MTYFKYPDKHTPYLPLIVMYSTFFVGANSITKEVSCRQDGFRKRDFGEILQGRYENMIDVCKKQNSPSSETLSLCKHTVIWRKQEKIAMCPVYKSGTTSWIHHLIDLSFAKKETKESAKWMLINGGDRKVTVDTLSKYESPSEWARYVHSYGIKDAPYNISGFIVVRHPFERLVSTYRDKLESYSRSFFKQFARRVVEKYRKQAIREFGEDGFNRIRSFRNTIPESQNAQNPKFETLINDSMLPTFWEFVQYVINDYEEINDGEVYSHIRPIHKHCCVCDKNYQKIFRHILKLEEMDTEERRFIEFMPGWEAKIDLKQPKLNVQRPEQFSSEYITRLYFTQLSRDDVLRLYRLYNMDFLLFDYKLKFNNSSFS